jgi:hypothetical protein
MANTPTIQADQVAEAFNAVPGVHLDIYRDIPAGIISTSSTSYVDIGLPSNPGTFNVPVAGFYRFMLAGTHYITLADQIAYYEVVIDEGESYEITIGGDDETWRQRMNITNDQIPFVFTWAAELTAGDHTFAIKWKVDGSTINMSTTSWCVLEALLVSGSGAGGTLSNEKILSAAWTSSVSHNVWQDVDNGGGDALTLTFDCAEGDDVLVILHSTVEKDTAVGSIFSRLVLDGTPLAATQIGEYTPDTDAATCMAYPWILRNLPAGSHIVKVQARSAQASPITFVWDSGTGDTARGQPTLQYMIFRGGQIPIEDGAGTEWTSTPRALQFANSLVEVDATGRAIITPASTAPGVRIDLPADQPASTINFTVAPGTQFYPAAAGEETFEVPVAGLYKVEFTGPIAGSSTSTYQIELVFDDGETYEQSVGADTTWQARVPGGHYLWPVFVAEIELTAGVHTVKGIGIELSGNAQIIGTGTSLVGDTRVTLSLVSGSSAGGVLYDDHAALLADYTLTASFTDIDNGAGDKLELVIDTAENERVLLFAIGSFETTSQGTTYLQWTIDGTPYDETWKQSAPAGFRDAIDYVRMSPELSAGSHTFVLQGKRNNGSKITLGTRVAVVRLRGGQVPIEDGAGTEISATPRALRFMNSLVELEATGRVEVTPASTTPGVLVRVPADQPSSDITFGASYTQFFPDTTGSESFTVPVAGKYRVTFGAGLYWGKGPSAGTGQIELRIDEGEVDEVTVGGDADDSWQVRVASAGSSSSALVGEVELAAGTHTLKAYGKNIVETGPSTIGSTTISSPDFVADFTLVSGSGAGGVLVEERVLASDFSFNSTTPADVTGLSVTVQTGDEDVLVLLRGRQRRDGTTGTTEIVFNVDGAALIDDGAGVEGIGVTEDGVNWSANISSGQFVSVSAGQHIFKVTAAIVSTGAFEIAEGAVFQVIRFRGGQVPIEADGVEKTATPRSLNFVEGDVNVDETGRANIRFNALVSGTILDSAEKTADQSGIATGSVVKLTELDLAFDTNEQENVSIEWSIPTYKSGSTRYTRALYIRVDSGSWEPVQVEVAIFNFTFTGTWSLTLGAGSHTVEFGSRSDSTLDVWGGDTQLLTWGVYPVAKTWAYQDRGGYARDENVPQLEYNTVDVVDVVAGPDTSDEFLVTLNDGKRYRANGPLSIDLSDTDGGLGAIEATELPRTISTHYTAYAVPTGVDNFFDVIASPNGPGTGPSDYTTWRYLGKIFNDASDEIRQFRRVGDYIEFPDPTETALLIYEDGGSEQSPTLATWYSLTTGVAAGGGTQRALTGAIPVDVAGSVDLSAVVDTDTGDEIRLYLESGQVQYTPSASQTSAQAFVMNEASSRTVTRGLVPLYNNDAYYRWESAGHAGLNFQVIVRGYVDKYLADTKKSELQIRDTGSFGPGVAVTMFEEQPASTQTIVSATYADIPGSALPEQQFFVPVAGWYDLSILLSSLSATVTNEQCEAHYRAIFDESGFGGFTEQILGSPAGVTDLWVIMTANGGTTEWGYKTVNDEIWLEAGTHKVKIQAKRDSGTTGPRVAVNGQFVIKGVLRSGSGAGGVISDEKVMAAAFTSSANHNEWQDIDNGGGDALTLDFDTAEGDDVLVIINATMRTGATAADSLFLRLDLDGSPIAETQVPVRIDILVAAWSVGWVSYGQGPRTFGQQ